MRARHLLERGRTRTRLNEQADRVLELEPDVVCLQEVTPVTAQPWLERLADAGLNGVLAPLPAAREGSRPLAVLTATRDGVEAVPVADVPWAERVLAARAGPLEAVNVHSPISPKPGLAKVLTHEAVFEHLRSGFRDAFRELRGFDSKEPTWEWPRSGGGYRLDHLIASAEVEVTVCAYRHDWRREDRLLYHSALAARLAVRT